SKNLRLLGTITPQLHFAIGRDSVFDPSVRSGSQCLVRFVYQGNRVIRLPKLVEILIGMVKTSQPYTSDSRCEEVVAVITDNGRTVRGDADEDDHSTSIIKRRSLPPNAPLFHDLYQQTIEVRMIQLGKSTELLTSAQPLTP